MRFTKMHGIGNDYVYIDCFRDKPPRDAAALSKAISDRHFGVGSDGLILICPSERADARMRMFNADGSEAEMCGNGIRCVAKYVYDHAIAKKNTLTIETSRGILTLEMTVEGGKARQVRVNMGEPILESERIPTKFSSNRVVNQPLPSWGNDGHAAWFKECGLDPRVTCVSTGNPHAVLYCDNVQKVPLESVGPVVENDPIFPRRINVHFVQVHSAGEVTMRTWERGSGVTLACGTGACAVCVAGVLTSRSGREIRAHLPGGDLQLLWGEKDNQVYMTGPAVEVFTGEWPE
jgi:diaminopimelate epimerase